MKKILSMLLLCSLLLACFAGCTVPKDDEIGSTAAPDGTDTMPPVEHGIVLTQADHELVQAVITFLEECFLYQYDLLEDSLTARLDEIKHRAQPLHVAVDPTSCYYVCGYYSSPEQEKNNYRHANEYTWVKYTDAHHIPNTYKGLEYVVAVQINPIAFANDLKNPNATVPTMQHMSFYETTFENGLNVADLVAIDLSFVYLNYNNKMGNLYISSEVPYHESTTVECIKHNGEYMIPVELYTKKADGTLGYQYRLEDEFGAYYDALMPLMKTGEYSVVNKYGTTVFYGLISLDDFAEVIKSNEREK